MGELPSSLRCRRTAEELRGRVLWLLDAIDHHANLLLCLPEKASRAKVLRNNGPADCPRARATLPPGGGRHTVRVPLSSSRHPGLDRLRGTAQKGS